VTQATRTGHLTFADYLDRAWREGALWTLIVAALYLVVALATYSPQDPGWSQVGTSAAVNNAGGVFGAWFADVALFLFGLFAYLIPITVAWSAYLVFRQRVPEPETKLYWLALRWVGFLLLLAAGSAMTAIHFAGFGQTLPNGVGIIGPGAPAWQPQTPDPSEHSRRQTKQHQRQGAEAIHQRQRRQPCEQGEAGEQQCRQEQGHASGAEGSARGLGDQQSKSTADAVGQRLPEAGEMYRCHG